MPGTKRRAPYKYSEQQTVRSSHRPLTPWLALAGKPVNRCPRTTCAYSDCRAFAGIPSRLFLLSESQVSTVSAVARPECTVRKRNGPNEKAGCDDPALRIYSDNICESSDLGSTTTPKIRLWARLLGH